MTFNYIKINLQNKFFTDFYLNKAFPLLFLNSGTSFLEQAAIDVDLPRNGKELPKGGNLSEYLKFSFIFDDVE